MAAKKPARSFAKRTVDDMKVIIARHIRKVSRENDWKLKELAEQAKISIPSAHKIMVGKEALMSLELLLNMAIELGFNTKFALSDPNE